MRIIIIRDFGLPCVPVGGVFDVLREDEDGEYGEYGDLYVNCKCNDSTPVLLSKGDYKVITDTVPKVFSDGLENWE